MWVEATKLVVFPALMAFAASSDLVTMTISNRVSIGLVIGFLVLAGATGMPLAEIGSHFGAGLVVLVLAFGCFAFGWIGGGDAKLAAATALWFGFGYLLDYLLCASVFGGVLTFLMLEFRRYALPAQLAGNDWIERLHQADAGVPYGIALAAAALLIYPSTFWLSSAG